MFKTTLPPHLLFVTDGDNDGGGTQQDKHDDDADGQQPQAGKTFTQADVDRLLGERAARERAKFTDYDALKAKAQKFDEHEQAQQTQAERDAQALQEAKADADKARSEALRYRAAAEHNIDKDHFDLIGDGPEDAVLARAERVGRLLAAERELRALQNNPTPPHPHGAPPGQPPSGRSGSGPSNSGHSPAVEDRVAAMAKARGWMQEA